MRKGETVMKILAINSISFKKRMIELLFDYLFIIAYLALLFLGCMTFYIFRLYKKWEFWEGESWTSIGLQEKNSEI